jgi:hypothetical protein
MAIEDVAFEMQTSAMAREQVMLFEEVVASPCGGQAFRRQRYRGKRLERHMQLAQQRQSMRREDFAGPRTRVVRRLEYSDD